MLLHFRLHLFECFPFVLVEIPNLGLVLTPDVVGSTTSGRNSRVGGWHIGMAEECSIRRGIDSVDWLSKKRLKWNGTN